RRSRLRCADRPRSARARRCARVRDGRRRSRPARWPRRQAPWPRWRSAASRSSDAQLSEVRHFGTAAGAALARSDAARAAPGATVIGEVFMRGLSLMLALLLSTALSAAPQRHPTPPPQPPPSHQPPPPASSPTVMPFPPLPPQPAGGLTPGVTFPFQDNPVYSPSRVRPLPSGFGFGGYGGYGGGYYYAPDATSAGAPATMAAAPQMETGMLRLDGTPASAQVFVDGYYVATLADVEASRVLTLPAGPHRVEIRASDYLPTTF